MKKTLLFLSIGFISSISFAQKAFDEFQMAKSFESFSSYTEKNPPTTPTDVTVSIDKNTIVNPIRQSLFGNNAVGWQGNLDINGVKENNWKNGSYSILRYPGGNWSNLFFWDGNIPNTILTESTVQGDISNLKDGTAAWMLETDEYPELLNFTGAEGIVCVNMGYAFYGSSADPVTTAADYAAAWVNQYNKVQNLGIKYWELGNENYGPWQAGFDLATPQKYADACVVFAQKMKAIDSTIQLGVVLYEGNGGFNNTPQAKDWNEIVLPIVQDIMDYAIIHHYPHPGSNKNDISETDIYAAISVVQETVEMFHNQTETYTNYEAGHFPIAITEFNARAGTREISRTNALFTTLMLGEYATYSDYAGVMQWDLQNSYDEYGGNHAAIATKDPFMNDGDANASLYAYYFMEKYFGDKLVASTSTDDDIILYPTTFDSGEMGVVLVNKGSTDKTVEIDLGAFAKGERMYWHTINGDDSDFDRTIYINDQGPGTTFNLGETYTNGPNSAVATEYEVNGVGGPQNYTSINPYSSIIPPAANLKFATSRYSVSYIVFETADGDCAVPDLGPNKSICGETEIVLSTNIVDLSTMNVSWSDINGVFSTEDQVTITAPGIYDVTVSDGINCSLSDQIEITGSIPVINLGEDTYFCTSTDILLESGNTSTNVTIEWSKNGSIISNENNYTATTPGTYTVTANATNCSSVSDEIVITSDLVSVKGDTTCITGGNVTLEILDTGNYSWYDVAEGGIAISNDLTYLTTINESKTFYVENNSGTEASFGKTEIDGTTFGNTGATSYEGANRTTILTVEQGFTLVSLTLFAQTDGADVVLNINGTNNYSNTWNFSNMSNTNGNVVELNALLEVGTYTIDLQGTTGGIKIQYDNTTQSEQELTDYASFVTGGGNTDWYGMFFDWKISNSSPCVRTPVEATLDITPGCITGTTEIIETEFSIFPNPTSDVIVLQSNHSVEGNLVIRNTNGLIVLETTYTSDSNTLNTANLPDGVYHIELNDLNGLQVYREKFIKLP